ncbi:MAG: YbaB/EbfC family nucleoid-associated protein [Chthoniobacterales bacterium]|jgi:DNA-binding YbaB/EbfC family protein|nr:YbaB/EbfC family nucleoid-associated protein [Chthoniobacterales bacterium]
MNIAKMMQAAATAQKKMAKIQEELAERRIEGTSGGGRVTVTASGTGEILSLKIAPEVVTPDDVEMLEDLILSAVRQAVADAKKLSESEMGKLTAGLGIPGLPF